MNKKKYKKFKTRDELLREFNSDFFWTLERFNFKVEHSKDLAEANIDLLDLTELMEFAAEINYKPSEEFSKTYDSIYNTIMETASVVVNCNLTKFRNRIVEKANKSILKNTYFVLVNDHIVFGRTFLLTIALKMYLDITLKRIQEYFGFIRFKGNLKINKLRIVKGYKNISKITGLTRHELVNIISLQNDQIPIYLDKEVLETEEAGNE